MDKVGDSMKFSEYKERSKPIINCMVKLLHRREMNAMLVKDKASADTLADDVRKHLDKLMSMQDEVMNEAVQAEDIGTVIEALIGSMKDDAARND